MPPRKTNRTSQKKNYRTSTWKTKTTRSSASYYPCNSPKYSPARFECQWRMGSYRNVWSQFNGAGMKTTFSPTLANRWIKYVNNGVRVYKFNNNDFSKHFGTEWAGGTPTAARQYLRKKYGPGVKDVTRGKGNCWLVATTKNMTGRPFANYLWK
ncbi:MAG: hypothetical protein KAY37_17175 [Phycisphaerae bacterium]|nr:hypothetical protein [Phycisphaerae bacterium]